MGSVRLYPNAITVPSGFNTTYWVNETGSTTSANIVASLSDDDTTTYVRTTSINGLARNIAFDNLAPGDIPTGARILGVVPYIKGKTFNANSGGYFGGYVRLGTVAAPTVIANQSPYFYRWVDYKSYPTLAGSLYSTNHKGESLTEAIINGMQIYISTVRNATYKSWQSVTMRITEMYVEVLYDEKPVTSSVTVSNTSDTPRPTVNWVYSDDLAGQAGFQVQVIRVSNGVTAYDSGFVASADELHELTKNIAIGVSYYARVRTAQVWNGPGGTFWSDWENSSNFTITVTPPPRATISVAQNIANGRNDVTLDVSAFGTDFDNGDTYVAIQGLDLSSAVPMFTPAEWAAMPGVNPTLYTNIFNEASAKHSAGFGIDNKWKFIEAKVVPNGASTVVFHDHTVKAGIARIYRTYTYKWNDVYGFLLTNEFVTNSYSGYAPQTVSMKGAWISAIEPNTNPTTGAVIEFAYDSYNFRLANNDSDSSEVHGKDVTQFNTSGYTFPIADFSSDETKSIEVKVLLPDAIQGTGWNGWLSETALRKLNARKCPVDYRDQRGQRIRGVISSMKFQNSVSGKEASFTITAVGEQFEDNNLG